MRATIMYRAGDVRVENVPDATLKEPTDALGETRSFRQSLALAESSCMVELEQYCHSLAGRIGRFNPNAVQLEGLAPAAVRGWKRRTSCGGSPTRVPRSLPL